MAIFKCKICGGTLEINAGETVATCEYCGTKQTLPKLDDEKKANLFDRANHFRRNNDFDKAMSIYEQILNEDTEDAESYWSIVLCRYGIEYVEDPETRRRVPTVNRAQYISIYADEDYKSAIKLADSSQRELYEAEAKNIDEIQKGILAISQNEEPFDIFICYKETDGQGKRTTDSVMAQDIYYQLTEQGYKVFFSRITLENKLGTEYEPYIFAALNSAKIMLIVGTKQEYFNAVWVKNEWSRFLSLTNQNKSKVIIPCYRDIDAYDLPNELLIFQSLDMGKIGFIQDLVRGVKKLVSSDISSVTKEMIVVQSAASGNASALLKRGFLALEDGEWEKADDFFEQALNQNAEDAQAYLGKLMAELKVSKQDNLIECKESFENMSNYQKVIRFADEKLKSELNRYLSFINNRNKAERLKKIYVKAMQQMNTAFTEEEFNVAINTFNEIHDYKDASQKVEECYIKIDQLKRKEKEERIEREIREEEERLKEKRRAEFAEIAKEKKKIFIKNLIMIMVSTIISVIFFIVLFNIIIIPNSKYNNALALSKAGKLNEAYNIFLELGEYKDAVNMAEKVRFEKTKESLKNINVGEYITFGVYEQDNDKTNGKEQIEWQVLEKNETVALLISKYALDCLPYNYNNLVETDGTWENSFLRKWLNDSFINSAFSNSEKILIETKEVTIDKDPMYTFSKNLGNPTQDEVFLLSAEETNRYFPSRRERACKSTAYAIKNGASVNMGYCEWWLRSPGLYKLAATVLCYGEINGHNSGDMRHAVRPALWIDISEIK